MEEDIWTSTIDDDETQEESKPDPIESLKAEYEAKFQEVSSKLPSDEEREILSTFKSLRQPKETQPSQAELDLQNTIKVLSEKGVITHDNPEVKRILDFIERAESKNIELTKRELQTEGFKSQEALQVTVLYKYHQELDDKEKAELEKLLTPFYNADLTMKEPVKIAQTLNAFIAKKEGAELPSRSIETSIRGQSETQVKSKPTRHEFFTKTLPKMSSEEQEKFYRTDKKEKYYQT